MHDDSQNQYPNLRQLIGESFNHNELVVMCFDLSVSERRLRRDTDELLIVDLIQACADAGRLSDLIAYCRNKRPHLAWPNANDVAIPASFDPDGPQFPLIHIPPANPTFTGRTDLLDAIQAEFQNQQSAIAITQAIAGLGGVGKTQLALAYAHSHRDSYDLIWWLNAENEPALAEALVALGRALALPVDPMDRPSALRAVLTWISSTDKRWLLVYDNVDSLTPRALRPLLPSGLGHLLITSRNPNWRSMATVLDVKVFTPDEAVTFLHNRLGIVHSSAADASWAALAGELDYLPLALEHAAAYMEARGKTASEYLALFQQRRQSLWARIEPPDAYHATITTTWDMGFAHAEQTPGAAGLLSLCCFLAPDNIPLATLQARADEMWLDDALTALMRYSLLTKQDGMITIHRLVQAVVRDQIGEELEKEWVKTAVEFMNRVFPFKHDDLSTWALSSDLLPHMLAVADSAIKNNLFNMDTAYLCNQIGVFFNIKGEYRSSFIYLERALSIHEQVLGSDHPTIASSLNNLGDLLQTMGQLAEARPYYERGLAIREQVLGSDHSNTADSLNIYSLE